MTKKINNPISLNQVQKKVARFRDERNWKQHHNPKNLVISILVEAAELAEHFQWETTEEIQKRDRDRQETKKVAMELADVMIYCLSLADTMGINLSQAIIQKLTISEKKFPIEKAGDRQFIERQRARYKFMELGGSLKSSVVLSDKQLKQARRQFETSWAEENK